MKISILSQIIVSIGGIAIMCLAAYLAAWSKGGGPTASARRQPVAEVFK